MAASREALEPTDVSVPAADPIAVGVATGQQAATTDVRGDAHELAFPAMGTTCHVLVHGRADLVERARARVVELEQRWSRFLPGSEITKLNQAAGRPVAVGNDTYLLVSRAVEAWRLTEGRYDPTVLRALLAAGYDRSFGDPRCGVHHGDVPADPAQAAPGCADVVIDPALHTVRLPAGVLFDGGGIGKGLAADLVVEELLDAGAYGASINLGGDVRVGGEAPTDHGWVLGVADPYDADRMVPVHLDDEAMVTSTRLMRQWLKAGERYHHVLDPRTGRPVDTGIDAVTVISGRAWWAEVLAKVVLVAGLPDAVDLLGRARATGLVAAGIGEYYELPGWREHVVELAG